jgi:hypothetical protein
MNRKTNCLLAAALAVSGATGCGGEVAGVGGSNAALSTVGKLEAGATVQRAYVGVDNRVPVGATPVVTPFDLVGGAQIELEVVTPDSSPVEFELWQAHVDGEATLVMPVDAPSGFALEDVDATEDSTWLIVFPSLPAGQVIVHMDCVGGNHGCSPELQPGDDCPAGWSCDEGLVCQLPVGVCGPLAGVGTCVVPPASCAQNAAPVCGCNGTTYPSECAARLGGEPILSNGACEG